MIAFRGAVMALAAALISSVAADDAAAPAAIERRYTATGSSDNTNACSPLELIWFRSGFEPQGPSLGLMGDPLYQEILKYVPDASAYNVVFDSNLYDMIVSVAAAGSDATKWINRRAAQCPNQRYFIAGYSKGTLPVHVTYPNDDVRPRVVASLVVGDLMGRNPYFPLAVFNTSWPSNGNSIKALCNKDDEICDPTGHGHEIHLHPAYLGQLPAAVQWMLKLYKKNQKAPFPYIRTAANYKRILRIL